VAGGNNRVAGESKQRTLGFVFCGEEEEAAKRGRGTTLEITTLWDVFFN